MRKNGIAWLMADTSEPKAPSPSERDSMLRDAQAIVSDMRDVVDALRSENADLRIARRQIRSMRHELALLDRELDERERAGITAADDLAPRIGRTYRTLRGIGESQVHMAAYLAHCLECAARFVDGSVPNHEHNPAHTESIRAASRTEGVGTAALVRFAVMFPAAAAKIDPSALARLATAWTSRPSKGKWPVLDDVWRTTFGVRFAKDSVKNRMTDYFASIENYPVQ